MFNDGDLNAKLILATAVHSNPTLRRHCLKTRKNVEEIRFSARFLPKEYIRCLRNSDADFSNFGHSHFSRGQVQSHKAPKDLLRTIVSLSQIKNPGVTEVNIVYWFRSRDVTV